VGLGIAAALAMPGLAAAITTVLPVTPVADTPSQEAGQVAITGVAWVVVVTTVVAASAAAAADSTAVAAVGSAVDTVVVVDTAVVVVDTGKHPG